MTPVPAEKADYVIETLNSLMGDPNPSDFSVRRLRNEVKKIREISVSEGDMILGMIASLEGDIDEVNRRHKNSIKMAQGSEMPLYNYAVSLAHLFYFIESAKYREKSFYTGDNLNLEALVSAIFYYFCAGKITYAYELYQKHAGLFDKTNIPNKISLLEDVANEIKSGQFDEKKFEKKMDLILSTLKGKSVASTINSVNLADNENEQWWQLVFKITCNAPDTLDLEDEIDEALSSNGFDSMASGYVSFSLGYHDTDYDEIMSTLDSENLPESGFVELRQDLSSRIDNILR